MITIKNTQESIKKKLNNLNENDLLYFYDKSPLVDNVINFYTTCKS